MSINESANSGIPGKQQLVDSDQDEINLLEYLYAIVKMKWFVVGVTVVGIFGGYLSAKMKGPVWIAEVVIAPKEVETQKTPNLSSLGAFGGLVASQLNMGGNASLAKIGVLLGSRDFNARLIEKYDLLPAIYRYKWPKVYGTEWDSSAGMWKKDFRKPNLLGMGAFLKNNFVKSITKDNLMTLVVSSRDSALSINIAEHYLEFLNMDIKKSVQKEAKENVEYLERQLISIGDPLLREKIQALIADEIEKTMVVSKEAFKVVDPVYMQSRFGEKRLYPIVFGVGANLIVIILIVIGHAFLSVQKSEADKLLIKKILSKVMSL